MANAFSKEERVAFEQMLEGFDDALVVSRNVSVYRTNAQAMERQSDIIWRPMPYIMTSYDGSDATSNFKDVTQLAVPASLGYQKHVPMSMTAKQLRDQLQEGRLGESAMQKLASDVNVACSNLAALQGTLVVKRTSSATGFDDIAQADSIMNEQGVMMDNRTIALSSRDYNSMAGNLAGRQTVAGKVQTAYEKAFMGNNAGFDTLKLDYAYRLTAAAGTTVTVNGANQYTTPKATSTASTGEVSNVDNRYQNLIVAVTSGTIKVGDCFTIAGVNAVHHITKQDTGQLKTFRVTGIVSGAGGSGTIQISPAIISGQGATNAELMYQNVTATPANGAAITWLNTTSAPANPFWHKDSIELLPGTLAIPENSGAQILRASTDQGIEVVMQKFYDINTQQTKFRWDVLFGVANVNPEMNGIMLFGQA